MPDNADLAAIFSEMADILDIQGANVFRIRAYRSAARTIETLGAQVAGLVAQDPASLDRIPGIGKGLHEKIAEYCARGSIHEHQQLKAAIPPGLLDLLRLQSLGPKRVRLVHDALGIDAVDKLEEACTRGLVRALPGLGEKSEAKLLSSIRDYRALQTGRTPFAAAEHVLEPYLAHLRATGGTDLLEPAGSYRRRRESVGDLDILATARAAPERTIAAFTEYPGVAKVLASGTTKASVVLTGGIQTDLRVVEPPSFGAALQYFTGSKEHNVAVRGLAKDKGLKLSEYGVFRGDTAVAGGTEEEVYAALGLAWIPPELRENRGELQAAASGSLPDLVSLDQIRGDLHMHSTWSDGVNSIADLARAARARGYDYIAITDHSKAVAVAHGLSPMRLRNQRAEIAELRASFRGFHILTGSEVDILDDGSLDFDDEVMAEIDFVTASVHSRLDMAEAAMTRRIVRALGHPRVHCLGHPTGRLVGQRLPYKVDMAAVIEAAAAHHVALEINSAPDRLDLDETNAGQARRAGVPLSVATDAHHAGALDTIRFGIHIARRAWCTRADVLNAWTFARISEWLASKPH